MPDPNETLQDILKKMQKQIDSITENSNRIKKMLKQDKDQKKSKKK
jgi:hypothetical protein